MTGAGFSNGGQHATFWSMVRPSAGLKVVRRPRRPMPMALCGGRSTIPILCSSSRPCRSLDAGDAPEPGHSVPIGKAHIELEGNDITIVAIPASFSRCLAAVETMNAAGISAEVIDLRTISPWDKEAVLASVAKTGRCLSCMKLSCPLGLVRKSPPRRGGFLPPVEGAGRARRCAVYAGAVLQTAGDRLRAQPPEDCANGDPTRQR